MSFEITIPRLGWSMEEGIFAGWLKKDGDVIRRGDALFELEGEKALQEVEALDDGVLRLMADGPQLGTVLKVGRGRWLFSRGRSRVGPNTIRQQCGIECDQAGGKSTGNGHQQHVYGRIAVSSSPCPRTGCGFNARHRNWLT